MRIGNGDMNKIGWDNFQHRLIAQNMQEILLHAGEANNKKGARMVEAIIVTVIIGAEAAWRTQCDLAAAAGDAGMALGRK